MTQKASESKLPDSNGFIRLITNVRTVYAVSSLFLILGVWWGWPTSFDQHDPTPRALKMLWNRSLDPGVRYWGAFGYQEVLVLAVLPATILKKILGLSQGTAEALMYLATRMIWAVKGLLIVVMGYHGSIRLFGDRTAAVACAWFICLSTGFIAWTHIPQVDIVHAFWYSAALLFTIVGWQSGHLRFLYLAAVFAGFSAGVKYIGGIVVLAPMVSVLMRKPSLNSLLHSFLIGAVALLVFIITTPLATGSPIDWLPGYFADVLANMNREIEKPVAFWTLPVTIWNMFGPAASLLGLIGIACWSVTRNDRPDWQVWVILFFSIFPYYLIVGSQHVATVRYVVPLLVPLAMIMSYAIARTAALKSLRAVFGRLVVTAMFIQAVLAMSLCIGLMEDSRYALADWLSKHTEKGDQVETTLNHRPYFVAELDFKEVTRPHFQPESFQMHKAMMEDRDSTVRRLFEWSSTVAGYNLSERPTWIEKERTWLTKQGQEFDTSTLGPLKRGSRYVVINLNTADHYVLNWPGEDPSSPNEKEFYRTVLSEAYPFQKVARFESIVPEWLRYPSELWINISPTIEVFEVRTNDKS